MLMLDETVENIVHSNVSELGKYQYTTGGRVLSLETEIKYNAISKCWKMHIIIYIK